MRDCRRLHRDIRETIKVGKEGPCKRIFKEEGEKLVLGLHGLKEI